MGHGIGLWLDPTTGQVMVAQSLYVACGVVAFLVSVALGALTAWLVLP